MDEQVKKEPSGRIFNCLQYEFNPQTGACLNFTEQNIIDAMKHKTISRYAYILHDKDTITEHDIEKSQGHYTDADLGKPKGRHWHIVIETKGNSVKVSTIAKWLGIPENMVELPKGRGAFIDCVEYLRHSDISQRLNGKYVYEADEVKANFNWQVEVEELVLRKTKYEKPLTQAQFLKNEVLYNGMSLKEVYERYPTIYQEELTTFCKLRSEYLSRFSPMPPHRINYYLEGGSGYGKDTMARSIARSLYPDLGEDAYFEIGGKKVTFDGYDGEPVIIWSEFRAKTFVNALGGYENVLQTIDIIPKDKLEHKKFGSIRLTNTVNIVTSTQPYAEFLRELIDENDPDKTQSNRRFPIIIPIHQDDFDIMINEGYLDNDVYRDYRAWQNVKGSFGKLAKRLSGRPEVQMVIENKLVTPIMDAHQEVEKGITPDEFEGMSDEDVLKYFESLGYGQVKDEQQMSEIKSEILANQMVEYSRWLDEWFDAHPTLRGTKNHPDFEWWLANGMRK